jgi:hypothetical protein
MGFMTEISILNDRFDEIERDPVRFVADIRRGMNRDDSRYFIGQTTIYPSHHADTAHVYLAARNSFTEAYPSSKEDAQNLSWRLDRLKEMRQYIALCTKETKRLLEIARGDGK